MHRRREGAGIDVILQQQDRHSINGSESDTGKHHKRGIPVGIFDVCFSDAPWQGRHACMPRRQERAGVDSNLQQQDEHSINGTESDTGKHHERGSDHTEFIPVGIFDVCFSDAPWEEQRACMHCRRGSW